MFSAREGITANTLRWWSSKLGRGRAKATPTSVAMVRVVRTPTVAAPARPAAGSVVVELLDARARLTVEVGVDVATLKTVLAALGVGGLA